MAKNNDTHEYRLKRLESGFEKQNNMLVGDKGILTNHIPHINQTVSSIKGRVNVLISVNIALIVAILATKLL